MGLSDGRSLFLSAQCQISDSVNRFTDSVSVNPLPWQTFAATKIYVNK